MTKFENRMTKFVYDGPVMLFGKCVVNNWHGETQCLTPAAAQRNLIFQYKKQAKLEQSSGGISIVSGKIKIKGE